MTAGSGHNYLKDHQLSGEVLMLGVNEASAAILREAQTAGSGHAARTLVKDGPLRIVVLGMRNGSTLKEHETDGPISLQVLSGEVRVETSGRADKIGSGHLLVLTSAMPHTVEALADSVVLLTLARWEV